MRSTRTTGKVVPFLSIANLTGSVSAVNPSDDLISVEYGDGDGNDSVTFSEFAVGYKAMALKVNATWSPDPKSLYHVLQANAGKTGCAFVYGRLGNAVVAAGKPVLIGTLSIPPTFGWSAEAGEDADTFECDLQIEAATWSTS